MMTILDRKNSIVSVPFSKIINCAYSLTASSKIQARRWSSVVCEDKSGCVRKNLSLRSGSKFNVKISFRVMIACSASRLDFFAIPINWPSAFRLKKGFSWMDSV
eukprot:27222_4